MTGPLVLVAISLLASVALHFAKPDTVTEAVCATLAVAAALAIPVGYLMGSF
ncbi:hypothetical protein STINGER_90 [Mycobacterium phage Stinger]|uniref:Uncharacterized protein n=1 Tax=Mycobacterium phage Stinger TaxID=1089137 RepID=G8I9L1_9CAUD|nr:hypothetical protein STINGER_90 [Mycobacterium phage Stinger]AER49404.1 hypothetical protein STINGER_90 [Mycobacterium phage Stinger]